MKASLRCVDLIQKSESFKSSPYLCPAGIPTIGFGSTRYSDGTKVTLQDAPITWENAIELLMATLATEYESAVNRYVQVPLTQGQFDALVDFAYNCGTQNLRTSTLLRLLNAGDYNGASLEFRKWNKGGGKVLAGLTARREAERKLFMGEPL